MAAQHRQQCVCVIRTPTADCLVCNVVLIGNLSDSLEKESMPS
jgi:hypothetical protein